MKTLQNLENKLQAMPLMQDEKFSQFCQERCKRIKETPEKKRSTMRRLYWTMPMTPIQQNAVSVL
jgi:hypothetical protein